MDQAVGICDLTGQTHTKCVTYEGMIDGCHVFITANWYLSEVMSSTVVQKWNFSVTLSVHSQVSPTAEHHRHLQI